MWKPLQSGSKTRILAKILGGQNTKEVSEEKSAGGIILGESAKETGADYGKLAIIHQISDEEDELKVGFHITISSRSGRSIVKDVDGSALYVLNRDEVWAYNADYVPRKNTLTRTSPIKARSIA